MREGSHAFRKNNRQVLNTHRFHPASCIRAEDTKDGTKFGAVIIINESRAPNSRYKRACSPRIGQWTANVTHGRMHALTHPPRVWPRHTHTRETPVPTGQRLAPPAHLWTFNRRIYFCHPMSQQIKRSGLGDVPCLCAVLQRTFNFLPLHKCNRQMRPFVTPIIFGWCIIIIEVVIYALIYA